MDKTIEIASTDEVQEDEIIVLGVASIETLGGMAGNEGVSPGIAFLSGISDE